MHPGNFKIMHYGTLFYMPYHQGDTKLALIIANHVNFFQTGTVPQMSVPAPAADVPVVAAGSAEDAVLAQEQAKLLETFQSIRQWQQQQQAALMRQQQAQMSKLLAEQDRITNLMGQQREGHWHHTPGKQSLTIENICSNV